jgi:hypothetical protein
MKSFLRHLSVAVALGVTVASSASAAEAKTATMYKPLQCGCCDEYAAYLQNYGFAVKVESVPNEALESLKKMAGVPEGFEGCHTLMIDGYVVEGLVPVTTLNKLLTERPAIRGITLPGMPVGSPGMPGPRSLPLIIYELTNTPANPREYARE